MAKPVRRLMDHTNVTGELLRRQAWFEAIEKVQQEHAFARYLRSNATVRITVGGDSIRMRSRISRWPRGGYFLLRNRYRVRQ